MFRVDMLLALLLLALGLLGLHGAESPISQQAAKTTIPTQPSEGDEVREIEKVMTHIFRVDVSVTEDDPRRVTLNVAGEHPDGCELPVHVAQSREGSAVRVEIYRELPVDIVCPMILRPYQDTIQLDGAFAAGSYRIHVNEHTQPVDI
ncbi:MAG: hypothetical protein OXE95_08685 [Chloroflexi bacterium]|nr:hypothetical protein [Chloroflexota bacterium]MCY4247635.1 hypothetical protein [Chloroflexota bacterium]